jgi:hypothetical protein
MLVYEYNRNIDLEYHSKSNNSESSSTNFQEQNEIQAFWIFTDGGVELFSYRFENINIDTTFLGGFISAINFMGFEINNNNLKKIVFDKEFYSIYKDPSWNFFILGLSKISANDQKVNSLLQMIHEKFAMLYPQQILSFVGDVASFQSFRKIIGKIMGKITNIDI